MNKKGIYAPVLVIFTLFLLSYAVISVVGKDSVYLELAGKNQIKLINKYQEGEFSKQYIKQSARNSINNVLYEFGQNGAIKDPKCKKNDYFVWDKDCKPNKEDFIFYFEKNFKKFLNLQKTPNLNFKYTLTKNNLIAKSENSLLFNLDKEGINTKKQNL